MATKNQLDELLGMARLPIPDDASRLETALLIAQFAHAAFSHNGDSVPSRSDPVTIMKEARAGSQFRCVEYSNLASWLMVACGINSRTINIMMKDVETTEYGAGHVVVEFYEGEQHGWVMADIQAGTVARSRFKLQSALELRESLTTSTIEDFGGNKFIEQKGMYGGNYKDWLQPYLYFLDRPQQLSFEYSDDSEPHFILVPNGDEPPMYFQRTHKLDLVVTSPNIFYKLPE